MTDPTALVADLGRRAAARSPQPQVAAQPSPSQPPPPGAVPTPNWFVRSALFGVFGNGRREFVKNKQLAAVAGLRVFFTGELLDQGDLDFWLVLSQRATPDGRCRVSSYFLLKDLALTDSGKNRSTIQARIERLRACSVRIEQGDRIFIGGLIDTAARAETHEWEIVLNPQLLFFISEDSTWLNWPLRRSLAGKPLAQWLLGFYSSHRCPFPLKIGTLRSLSGSSASSDREFKKDLRRALEFVEAACAAHGLSFRSEIQTDLVYVTSSR